MQQKEQQEFDNTLKALFGNEAKEIVPRLVPGTEVIDDKNIEIDRTILKADLVYNVMRNGRPHILDMELSIIHSNNLGITLSALDGLCKGRTQCRNKTKSV